MGANGVSSAQVGLDSLSAHLECPVTCDLRFHTYSKGERGEPMVSKQGPGGAGKLSFYFSHFN